MNVNESIYVPLGSKHRLSNPTSDQLIIIEIQNGNYLGEDDIIRFEDKYGRKWILKYLIFKHWKQKLIQITFSSRI